MFLSWIPLIALCSLAASEAKRMEAVSALLDSTSQDTEAHIETPYDDEDLNDNIAEALDELNLEGVEHVLDKGAMQALQALQDYYSERKRKLSVAEGELARKGYHQGQGKGKRQGHQQGKRQGHQQGKQQGHQLGKHEGHKQVKHQGHQQGKHQGQHLRSPLKSKKSGIQQDLEDIYKTGSNRLGTGTPELQETLPILKPVFQTGSVKKKPKRFKKKLNLEFNTEEVHQAMQPALPTYQEFSVLLSKIKEILKNQKDQSMKQVQQASGLKVTRSEIQKMLNQLMDQQKLIEKNNRLEDITGGVCEKKPFLEMSDDHWKQICSFITQFNTNLMEFLMEPNRVMGLIGDILGEREPQPSDCKCGLARRTTRIIGGEVTEANEYPWQVALSQKYGGELYFFCGGSLISDQWVLTAAHCTDGYSNSDIMVTLGEHDLQSPSELSIPAEVAEIVNHPSYNDCPLPDYDFSLIRLESAVDFDAHEHIRPICLPLPDDDSDFSGLDAIVTGWGVTSSGDISDQLRELTVQVLSNSQCYSQLNLPACLITEQMICAGVNGFGSHCYGDSGGPLITSNGGDGVTPGQNYQHIGVASWVYGECAPEEYPPEEYPAGYARTSKQLSWITSTTENTFRTCPRA